MPLPAQQGMAPVAEVDLDELRTLQADVRELVERDLAYLAREERLASSLHTLYGVRRPPVPGDLVARSLRTFSAYVRFGQ